MQTNEGTVQLYSDLLHKGVCTMHTAPQFPWGPNDPSDSDADDGSDAEDGSAGDDSEAGGNGSFLDWLLGNSTATGGD